MRSPSSNLLGFSLLLEFFNRDVNKRNTFSVSDITLASSRDGGAKTEISNIPGEPQCDLCDYTVSPQQSIAVTFHFVVFSPFKSPYSFTFNDGDPISIKLE